MLEHEDNSIVRVMIDDDKNGRKDVECLSHAISLSTGDISPDVCTGYSIPEGR